MLRLVPVPQCSVLHWSAFKHTEEADNGFCYIDKRVLVENKPLVKFTRNFIRDSSGEFSISSLVRISTTPFPAFTRFHFGNATECCKLKRYKLVKPSDFINPLISRTSTKREDPENEVGTSKSSRRRYQAYSENRRLFRSSSLHNPTSSVKN